MNGSYERDIATAAAAATAATAAVADDSVLDYE